MERPLFVARDPRVFATQPGAPAEGRVFVSDEPRWYERLKDENGDAYYVLSAESSEEFHGRLEAQREPAVIELAAEEALAGIVLDEFDRTGSLY
jgi:hypothetical protein